MLREVFIRALSLGPIMKWHRSPLTMTTTTIRMLLAMGWPLLAWLALTEKPSIPCGSLGHGVSEKFDRVCYSALTPRIHMADYVAQQSVGSAADLRVGKLSPCIGGLTIKTIFQSRNFNLWFCSHCKLKPFRTWWSSICSVGRRLFITLSARDLELYMWDWQEVSETHVRSIV